MTDRTAAALASALPAGGYERRCACCVSAATALREAADDLYSDNGPMNPLSTATWLRWRAGQIDGTDPPQTFAEHTAAALALIHDHVEAPE